MATINMAVTVMAVLVSWVAALSIILEQMWTLLLGSTFSGDDTPR